MHPLFGKKVLMASGRATVRHAVYLLLKRALPDVGIKHAKSHQALHQLVPSLRPQLVVVDVAGGRHEELAWCRTARALLPETPLLLLVDNDSPRLRTDAADIEGTILMLRSELPSKLVATVAGLLLLPPPPRHYEETDRE